MEPSPGQRAGALSKNLSGSSRSATVSNVPIMIAKAKVASHTDMLTSRVDESNHLFDAENRSGGYLQSLQQESRVSATE